MIKVLKSKIKIRLVELGITQQELADEFGVSKQTLNAWVTGRVNMTLDNAFKLAKRLDCKVDDLFEYKEG